MPATDHQLDVEVTSPVNAALRSDTDTIANMARPGKRRKACKVISQTDVQRNASAALGTDAVVRIKRIRPRASATAPDSWRARRGVNTPGRTIKAPILPPAQAASVQLGPNVDKVAAKNGASMRHVPRSTRPMDAITANRIANPGTRSTPVSFSGGIPSQLGTPAAPATRSKVANIPARSPTLSVVSVILLPSLRPMPLDLHRQNHGWPRAPKRAPRYSRTHTR